jgi:mono/diheme cytochrome c family protein
MILRIGSRAVRSLGAVLLLGATLPTMASANDNARSETETGRELAERLCARCHAVGKTGDSPHDDAPPFRLLAQRWPVENLAEALAEGIVVGHPDMPSFEFSSNEISALLVYLDSLAR